jgi:hypothetical protein
MILLRWGGARLAPPGRRADNKSVLHTVELVLVILLPTAAGYALLASFGAWGRLADWRYRRRDALRPAAEPIERLTANLRRLRVQLDQTETRSGLTAKHARLTALRGAYLDALGDACTRLEVRPPDGGARAPLAEIYRAEAALRERGLDVREPLAH